MDSLVANYASSDDDEVWKESATSAPPTRPASLSLPPPKPSSSLPSHRLSSSLPPPKSHNPSTHHPRLPSAHQTHGLDADGEDEEDNARKHTKNLPSSTMSKPPSSFFSSLPPPRSSSTTSSSSLFSAIPLPKSANPPSVDPNPRKIVQFKPPIDPSVFKSSNSDDDDDDDGRERKPSKDSSSAPPKALSSMLPAPKNSLCLAPAPSSAASRRSVLQAGVPAMNPTEGFGQEQETTDYENYADAPEMVNPGGFGPEQDMSGYQSSGIYDGNLAGVSMIPVVDGSLQPGSSGGGVESSWDPSYGGSGDYGSYAVNWSDRSAAMPALEIRDMGRIAGKRGRNQTPTEIVEVKQDELMKNRPREDQTKLTGIAFGPSYQPVSSGKGGKPSKLHKRKHQIGSLYFDMKQKEMELSERRSKGLLTKAETHAKYGW